ncbi:bifunctional alpha,alpha-trehalose-phosphate synthase (UDP-forming)/trehalose-phosphatase [Haliangium ochraceum]|uniref:Alpha,alpha-trehalose-phosphate synthase n=1 Tax=Haliangium ochraceum (strain DSM 14365 / JCM 11303 / SMP-2) TaxID=502025 RepID=D0LHA0_HALO1|nr:bifunctional alpha,alpha-trehalose-phosphate synthase (UDP-forming)/trehalose-phosphatase [Haliangium ochraceum]ACY18245.1 trehalose-phosphatase [Haliangium ochraceum DSM 14365]
MSRVLIVSNRLPITVKRTQEGIEVERSAGGLATGLRGVHERGGGMWIGWPGVGDDTLSDAERASIAPRLDELRVVPVPLTEDEIHSYYEGFCNGILWPLFHYLMGTLPLEFQGYELYEDINRRFADAICAQHQPGDVVWVHDYQLMLVPSMVRKRIPDANIGYFLHIPFPSSEVFRTLPFRRQLLRGLLGADLIGFHTATYMRHFASASMRTLGIGAEVDSLRVGGRHVRIGVFPMGIDVDTFAATAARDDIKEKARALRGDVGPDYKVIVGVDRLDYTKGIRRRLLAFERLLHKHPELRGKVRLVQCAAPSRTNVEAYQDFRHEVEAQLGSIVGRYATPDWVPVHFIMRGTPMEEIVTLYRAADVALVTPIRDGMNLVAKEFIASRDDEDGVLVLSEFAGAASELAEAVMVNPFDVDGMADELYAALTMPEDERRTRMRGLRRRVMGSSVQSWAQSFLDAIAAKAKTRKPRTAPSSEERIAKLRARLREAPYLILLLDYEGTLTEFASTPQLARPGKDLYELLARLAKRPNTEVHITSGRDRETMERWLGKLPVTLHAEHGFWMRAAGGEARETATLSETGWRDAARDILRGYAERTPGALVEEKPASLAFHYRAVEPDFGTQQANELRQHLLGLFSNAPVEIVAGNKVIELRPQGVHKGRIVERLAADIEHRHPEALLVAFGDDSSDEDTFAALPEHAVAIRVGSGYSQAPYRVSGVDDVRELLSALVD